MFLFLLLLKNGINWSDVPAIAHRLFPLGALLALVLVVQMSSKEAEAVAEVAHQ